MSLIGRSLYLSYGVNAGRVRAVRNVTVSFEKGHLTVVKGAAHSGKTSLLYLLGCVLRPDAGEVIVNGVDTSSLREGERIFFRRQNIGFIFQTTCLMQGLTVLQNVALSLPIGQGVLSIEVSTAALWKVGLGPMVNAKTADLSRAERRRVSIAQALARNPGILLADEPAGPLDNAASTGIAELLVSFATGGRVVAVASSDSRWLHYAGRIVEIENGRVLLNQRH